MNSISLCIPAYNAGWCLPRLLQSALNQSIPFNEILVYDDGSTDNTAETAKEWGAIVIQGKNNIGCSAAKNELAKQAKSNWLFFIDADDELYPSFSTVAEKWVTKRNASDIVLMRYRYINHSSGEIINEPYYVAAQLKEDPLKYTIKNKIVNFELIKKEPFLRIAGFDTDPDILYIEDRAFSIKAAVAGLTFDAEEEIICIKYFFPSSMSSANGRRWPEAGYHLWNKTYRITGNKYLQEISEQLYQNAIWAAKASAWKTMKKSIGLAQQIKPDIKPDGSLLFRFFFKISSSRAFFIRELILRKLKRNN
jgi:glycosyltransferase involved in cell wall biosynthesis